MKYSDMNDYELLSYISESDEQARNIIFEKYKPLIIENAKSLYNYCQTLGLDLKDLIQEGLIGLNEAIKTFNETCDTKFYTYAVKCINSHMISCIVKAGRKKHKILNDSILLELYDEDQTNGFGKSLIDNSYNPEELLINKEDENELLDIINKSLDETEKQILELKISGFKYKEIAQMLGKNEKFVDNCMTKIRTKLKNQIYKRDTF